MKKTLTALMMVLLAVILIVSCNGNPDIPVMHKVTFDFDNGSDAEVKEVKDSEKIARPDAPTKTGYTFLGWYDGDETFDFDTAVRKDYSLKAKWKIQTFTVSFDVNGGTGEYSNQTINYGEKMDATKVSDPTMEGHNFLGWYDGDNKVDIAALEIKKDYALKAKWDIETFSVSFNSDGGTPERYETQSVDFNGTIATAPETPSKTGYTFEGWYNGDNKFEFGTTKVTGSIELKAKWKIQTFTVSFDVNGGTGEYANQTINYGEKMDATKVSDPTMEGHNFLGWYDGDNKVDIATLEIKKDYALKAKWEIHTFTVSFDANGGNETYANQTINYGQKIDSSKVSNPTMAGFTFLGWYEGENKVEIASLTVTKNHELKAKWSINSYTVSFNSDGGTPSSYESESVEYNKTIANAPTEPSKTGYTFGGWYNGDNKFEFGTTKVTGNIVLKAKWNAVYTVTFNVEGNTTTIASKTTNADGKVEAPTDKPTKSGWFFDYWATEENGTTAFDFTNTVISANTTLYAVFRDYYKVGDIGPAGGTIIYDCDADNTDEDADGADNLKSDVCGWRYLEAAPTDAPYGSTAQQYSWGPEENYATGTAIGDGWKNAAIFMDEVGYPNTFPSAKACDDYSVTVDGVTYDDWYLPSIAELQLVYNNREKVSGYIANGNYCSSSSAVYDGRYIAVWVIDKGSKDMRTRSGSRYIRPIRAFLTAGTTNPPVVANPTPKYNVTFKLNDGTDTTYTTVTVKEGKTVSKPSNPTKDGYIFTKWTTDAGGNNEYEFTSTVSGTFTLYAQWISDTITKGAFTWKVLYVDTDNSRMLVISENILATREWDTNSTEHYGQSTVQQYLDSSVYYNASLYTCSDILSVNISDENITIGNGSSHLFLLSKSEVNTYFGTKSKVATFGGTDTSWWLRSCEMDWDTYANKPCYVDATGSFASGEATQKLGVRPAMWLSLSN